MQFCSRSFTHPEYELVVLHPEHLLPRGNILPVYDPQTGDHKTYVASQDRRLRESFDPNSPCFPSFTHDTSRFGSGILNVFAVILNAEIKFRR